LNHYPEALPVELLFSRQQQEAVSVQDEVEEVKRHRLVLVFVEWLAPTVAGWT
jgi:hypothetical protein